MKWRQTAKALGQFELFAVMCSSLVIWQYSNSLCSRLDWNPIKLTAVKLSLVLLSLLLRLTVALLLVHLSFSRSSSLRTDAPQSEICITKAVFYLLKWQLREDDQPIQPLMEQRLPGKWNQMTIQLAGATQKTWYMAAVVQDSPVGWQRVAGMFPGLFQTRDESGLAAVACDRLRLWGGLFLKSCACRWHSQILYRDNFVYACDRRWRTYSHAPKGWQTGQR